MRAFALLLPGIGLLSVACGGEQEVQACDAAPGPLVASAIGPFTAEPFDVGPLSECRFRGTDVDVVVRIEAVPDARLFLAHSVEGTDPSRVRRLDIGQEAVELADEALLTRHGDHVAMVTATGRSLAGLVPVLEAVADYLRGR